MSIAPKIKNRIVSYLIIIGWTFAGLLVIWFVTSHSQQTQGFNWALAAGIAIGVIYFIAVLWEFPKSQVSGVSVATQEQKGKFELENEARRTIVQILGGLAIVITLYSTTETLRLSRESLDLAREGQLADRMSRAYTLFAQDNSKLGGIYTLESVASVSAKDHWPVIEVLSAYVRGQAAWSLAKDRNPSEARPDIDAVITVLRRRKIEYEKNQLIEYGDSDALLSLPGWQTDSELQKVIDLREVDLRNANLEMAYLKRITISGTHFENANLSDAHLERAFALGADFDSADLRGAHLQWAYVAYATFQKAQIQGADFRHAVLLTQEQIDEAEGDLSTQLPPDLHRPPNWH